MEPAERIFQVNDLSLHALHWTPDADCQNGLRWLCSHGWLDNAGSFNRIAEQLCKQGHELIAFDMAGCGRSQHRSLHGGYNLWDDILDIQAMVDVLGWDSYGLMGHSRGAMVSSLYASTQPVGLKALALIDGILPPFIEADPFSEQLRDFMKMRNEMLDKNRRQQALVDASRAGEGKSLSLREAWQQRSKNCLLDYEDMLPILQRGLTKVPEGYFWSHDHRLKGRSVYRLSEADQYELIKLLSLPGLLLIAQEGRLFEHLESFKQSLPHFDIKALAGPHHLHMQAKRFQSVVDAIQEFSVTLNKQSKQRD